MESAYESCLCAELAARKTPFRRQLPVRIQYKNEIIDIGYRIDLLVEDVVVELKAVDRLLAIHQAQLLTYMRLARKEVGLLINFNTIRLVDGVIRMALTPDAEHHGPPE